MRLKNDEFKDVNTIVFDFGNVLLDIDLSLTIAEFEKLNVAKFNPKDLHPDNKGVFLEMELGLVSVQYFVDHVKGRGEIPNSISTEQVLKAWNAMLLPYDYRRFELLDELRKDYKIILLSNTNEAHHNFFEALFDAQNPFGRSFRSFFDRVFYSDEMKLRKPGREIYDKVAQEECLDVKTTLFIDDNAPNLVEPEALGWKTYHLVRPETVLDMFA